MTLVWHVFGTMDIGGAELRTLDLDREMRAHDCRFDYVALSGRAGALDEQIVADGGKVHHLALGPRFPWRFVREARRHRPDVLDSHVATFSGMLLLLGWLSGIPVRIAHFRSDGDGHEPTPRRRIQRALMVRLIGRFATHIVGVSPGTLEHGYRRDWESDSRASVIPNGLPIQVADGPAGPHALDCSPDEVVALHVGRPSPEKNRAFLPGVVAEARRGGWKGKMFLVGGEGGDGADLAAAVAKAGPDGRVVHLGPRRNVRHLMAGADVVVLPSMREGLPGVVLEALSVGTPVIAADLPGCQYIASLIPGVHIVPDRSVDAWAQQLRDLGKTSVDRRRTLAAGFAKGPFMLDRVAAAHLALYR